MAVAVTASSAPAHAVRKIHNEDTAVETLRTPLSNGQERTEPKTRDFASDSHHGATANDRNEPHADCSRRDGSGGKASATAMAPRPTLAEPM
jgi:hypothetical protein